MVCLFKSLLKEQYSLAINELVLIRASIVKRQSYLSVKVKVLVG